MDNRFAVYLGYHWRIHLCPYTYTYTYELDVYLQKGIDYNGCNTWNFVNLCCFLLFCMVNYIRFIILGSGYTENERHLCY